MGLVTYQSASVTYQPALVTCQSASVTYQAAFVTNQSAFVHVPPPACWKDSESESESESEEPGSDSEVEDEDEGTEEDEIDRVDAVLVYSQTSERGVGSCCSVHAVRWLVVWHSDLWQTCTAPVISHQSSVNCHQSTVISHQPSVINHQIVSQ